MNPPKEWLVPGSVHLTLAVTDWMDSEDDQPPDPTLTARANTTVSYKCAFFLPPYSMGTETDWDWELNTN